MYNYKITSTVVRTVYGNSKGFVVKVGMHQGSALSLKMSFIVLLFEVLKSAVQLGLGGFFAWFLLLIF